MNTHKFSKTTRLERDPIYNLEREMKIRGFSPRTVKSYLYYNKNLLIFARKSAKSIGLFDIKEYLLHLSNKKLSSSTINTAIQAIKFYYTQILRRKFLQNNAIKKAKKDKKLPVVLSKNEILNILGVVKNIKHKLILACLYSSGLRVSEITRVKVKDFDFENKLLNIRQAKGMKDRVTIIAEKLAVVLRKYVQNKKADDYIFSGFNGNKLTERTVQIVFKNALLASNIKKTASCHSLRHSFATHLLEAGTNIRYIQALLGHSRLETTQIYTKVANNKIREIVSPLDG